MKKDYLSPAVDIHRLEHSTVLCTSDNSGALQNYDPSQNIWDLGQEIL